jgi:hypothetical protein
MLKVTAARCACSRECQTGFDVEGYTQCCMRYMMRLFPGTFFNCVSAFLLASSEDRRQTVPSVGNTP